MPGMTRSCKITIGRTRAAVAMASAGAGSKTSVTDGSAANMRRTASPTIS